MSKRVKPSSTAVAVFVGAILFAAPAEAILRQQQSEWCWASATQEVLGFYRIYDSQAAIAARLTGWPQNRPAYPSEIVWLLASYGVHSFQANRPASPQELYWALGQGDKIIALITPWGMGHFVVLEGIDPSTGGIFVADPFTGFVSEWSASNLYATGWQDSVVIPP